MRISIQLWYMLLLTFIFVNSHRVFAGQESNTIDRLYIDSLKNILNTESRTTAERTEILLHKGIRYIKIGKYDSAQTVLRQALQMKGGQQHQGGRVLVNLA
ncbi:MAG: hypothetical protein LBS79_07640, partial [Tannerella sp.]|nr:hypothetical protein [Tannerella sp.]